MRGLHQRNASCNYLLGAHLRHYLVAALIAGSITKSLCTSEESSAVASNPMSSLHQQRRMLVVCDVDARKVVMQACQTSAALAREAGCFIIRLWSGPT